MWTQTYTGKQKALAIGLIMTFLGVVIVVGLLLQEHGPGNMGTGFLVGAGIGVIGVGIAAWRIIRRPDSVTTLERAWTRSGDERDDQVLTGALAVVGLLAFPLTAVATVAIGLGAAVEMMLALLLMAEITVGAVAFTVINRRN